MSFIPNDNITIMMLTINLNIHSKKLLILKNNNNVVKLPKNAPKIILLMLTFLFKIIETPNNNNKSNIKLRNKTKST